MEKLSYGRQVLFPPKPTQYVIPSKHDCKATLSFSLNSISLNTVEFKKGDVIENLEVYQNDIHTAPELIKVFGLRYVTYRNKDGLFLGVHSNDFDFEDLPQLLKQ